MDKEKHKARVHKICGLIDEEHSHFADWRKAKAEGDVPAMETALELLKEKHRSRLSEFSKLKDAAVLPHALSSMQIGALEQMHMTMPDTNPTWTKAHRIGRQT